MDLTSLKILFVPMMQILLCVVITTLFKMAMHVPKKKDEAEAKGEEDGKKKENGKTGELTNGKRKAEVKADEA